MLWTLAQDLVRQLLTHAQPSLVNRDTIHQGVGTRQVNVLEDAGCEFRRIRALAGEELAVSGDVNRFARRQVANQGKAEHVERYAFGGDHVLDAFVGMALTEHDRANRIGVAEADDAVTGDHRHYRVAAAAALVDLAHRGEDVLLGRLQLAAHGKFVGEHVEQHFRVGAGIHMAQIRLVDLLGQLIDIGQVAVVRQGNAVRRVDVERLCLGGTGATRGGVTDVADPHVADQALHMALLKDVANQAVILAQKQPAVMARDDTGCILAAVLQYGKRVIQRLIDVRLTDDADNATHARNLSVITGRPDTTAGRASVEKGTQPGGLSDPANHWPLKPRMRFFDQSAIRRKCGNNVDSRHQRSCSTGARLSNPASTTTNRPPRAAPNTMPRKRSVPDKPVTLISSPIRKLTSAPTSKVATNSNAQAAMTCAEGVLMYSARWWDNAPPNIHATTPATIQVTSESASFTKPRFKLIRLDTAMTAMMAQSTQVNATMSSAMGKRRRILAEQERQEYALTTRRQLRSRGLSSVPRPALQRFSFLPA